MSKSEKPKGYPTSVDISNIPPPAWLRVKTYHEAKSDHVYQSPPDTKPKRNEQSLPVTVVSDVTSPFKPSKSKAK